MKPFRRRFNVDHIAAHLSNERSLVRLLFDRWVLPGQAGDQNNQPPLRLALRDGYLNFYANGQSVAKLSTPCGSPRIEVASKYLSGAPYGFEPTREKKGISLIEGLGLEMDAPARLIDHMVRKSGDHSVDEKRFVEHLMAANPNVIEVEMALPGDDDLESCMEKRKGKRVAPRMDLVLAHVLPDGRPVVDFWEAKLANNGELRATLPRHGGSRDPHVCHQLFDYEAWIKLPHRAEQVKAAFHNMGAELERLAELAKKDGAARHIWRALAARAPLINPQAGIVIGNYLTEGSSDTPMKISNSFVSRGHRARLERFDDGRPRFTVREVESRDCQNRLIVEPLPGNLV